MEPGLPHTRKQTRIGDHISDHIQAHRTRRQLLVPGLITLVSLLASAGVSAAYPVTDLTGTVVDQSGAPLAGLVVSLASTPGSDTTDSGGRFALNRRGVYATSPAPRAQSSIRVLPDAVAVSVDGRAAQPVTLSLYGTDGRRVARLFDGTLSPGRHVLPLHVAGRARAGHFVALLDHGRTTSRIRLIERNGRCAASSVTTHHREGAATAAVHATAGTGSNLPALDSLIIVHRAIDTHTVGIPLTDGEVAVTVDLIPRGIVELAMAEEHRCPAEVGVERRSHPGALKDYLRRTGRDDCDYEAWCSEFVSWVYKAAGMPFTGGREGGWMFTYSMAIKRWFAARGRFVARTDPAYQRFTPAPGDYIRYRNSWGGHSGIVHKVEGTTLYTIEGNIGNRVVRKTIRNYKQRADIDGFGMVSGARDIEVVVGRRAGRT